MTIAWAIIIVAILFFLHKYQLLGKTLRITEIVTAVIVIGILAWIGWGHFATSREQRRWKEQVARYDDCLNATTGKVHPVAMQSPPWCESYESLHRKGAPIDEWALSSDMPTVPPGDYYVTDGDRNPDGIGAATPAQLCVDSYWIKHCYAFPTKIDEPTFGLNASAEEIKESNGGHLILFTAEDEAGNSSYLAIALLANNGGSLENLLPDINYSGDYNIVTLPAISVMPILVTALYEWGNDPGECHACPHHVRITSYVYGKEERRDLLPDEGNLFQCVLTSAATLFAPLTTLDPVRENQCVPERIFGLS